MALTGPTCACRLEEMQLANKIGTKLLLHLKQQSHTKENVDQGMERDSQLVGASHLVYKQLVLSKGYDYLGYKSPLTLALNLVEILIHLRILIEQS